MNDSSCAVALDVGGTSVKSGLVRLNSSFVDQRIQTPIDSSGTAESILSALTNIIRMHLEQIGSSPFVGIGVAFPGPFDYQAGICLISGVEKYESLFEVNIGHELRDRLGLGSCPIQFRNDAEAAILGECLYGAGVGYTRVIGVTMGTGFGSAFMIAGRPQTSGEGVPEEGWLYPYPVHNVRADDYFSIRGLQQQLRDAAVATEDPKLAAQAARHGDVVARRVFSAFGETLGGFLAPFVTAFSADAVIVLGGLAGAFDLFGPSCQDILPIPLVSGVKGTDAAMLGAVQFMTEDPTG